jgi:hypothetical protein
MADSKPHPDYAIYKFSMLGNPRLGQAEDRISISPDHMAEYNAKFYPPKPSKEAPDERIGTHKNAP